MIALDGILDSGTKVDILGVKIDSLTFKEASDKFKSFFSCAGCSGVVTPNSEMIYYAQKHLPLMNSLNSSDLSIPDGIGVVYASRILGSPLPERVAGFDLLEQSLPWLAENQKTVFLLGGRKNAANYGRRAVRHLFRDNPSSVAELAAQSMIKRHPDLIIAGTHHGYFAKDEENQLINLINKSNPDLLCIGLGSPKQEVFLHENKHKLKAKAAICIGGGYDIWAGLYNRAPLSWQEKGLEWLFRLFQQPERLTRMYVLPLFILMSYIERRDVGSGK